MTTETTVETVFDLRHMTPEQFGQLGVAHMAYIKPMQMNGAAVFAIHAADGAPMELLPRTQTIATAIKPHDQLHCSVWRLLVLL